VAGRAGRGDVEGEVIVQSFTPFHPAIQFARRHDFEGFYEAEMEFREQLKYPPYTRAALLTLRGRSEEKVSFSAEHLKKTIEEGVEGISDLVIAGPAPAPLLRAETFYRHQIMLRTGQMSALSRELARMMAKLRLPAEVTLTVDIDPMNLM
jgi:primosomal protein N' (replication factor Y)